MQRTQKHSELLWFPSAGNSKWFFPKSSDDCTGQWRGNLKFPWNLIQMIMPCQTTIESKQKTQKNNGLTNYENLNSNFWRFQKKTSIWQVKINFSMSKWFQLEISEKSQGPSFFTMKVHTGNTEYAEDSKKLRWVLQNERKPKFLR